MQQVTMRNTVQHIYRKRRSDDDGFSLQELVVAVAIMLIIAVIAFISYQGFTDDARQAAVERASNDVFTAVLAADSIASRAALPDELQRIEDEYNSSSGNELTVEIEQEDQALTVTATGWDGRYVAVRSTQSDLSGMPAPEDSPTTPEDESHESEAGEERGIFRFTTSAPGELELYGIAEGSTITYGGQTYEILEPLTLEEYLSNFPEESVALYIELLQNELGEDWEEEATKLINENRNKVVQLPIAGEYTIRGEFDTVNGLPVLADVGNNIDRVIEWDNTETTSVSTMFYDNPNNIIFDDTPPETITNMSSMFFAAKNFNQDVSDWDVSNVENMNNMFRNAESFNNGDRPGVPNTPLTWSTDNLSVATYVFGGAASFNQDVSSWDMSNVQEIAGMFSHATLFNNGNQPLEWDTFGNVEIMTNMFSYARSFNQNLNSFDVSRVKSMSSMFFMAETFNNGDAPGESHTPLTWDTSSLEDVTFMLYNAQSFNQDISSWDTSNVTRYNNFDTSSPIKDTDKAPQWVH